VYVAGAAGGAVLWKNGVMQKLSGDHANASGALAVFVR
jgi:hypothetical protein